MPIVTVETNLKYGDLPEDFGPSLSKFIAVTLDKPEERITISLLTDRRMWRAGSDAPMIQMHIAAIAAVSTAEQNEVHAPKLSHFLQEKTKLPMNRVFLLFYPLEPYQIGKNGELRTASKH